MKSPNLIVIDETDADQTQGRSLKSKAPHPSSKSNLMEDIIRIVTSDDMEEIKEIVKDDDPKLPKIHNDKYMMIDAVIDKTVKSGRQEFFDDLSEVRAKQVTSIADSSNNDKIIIQVPKNNTIKTLPNIIKKKPADEKPDQIKKEGFKFPKLPFFGKEPEEMTNAIDAIREGGGIIIQRLKVRKGGIAIAGPGGVATAGSGGTAIVGPGGLALTHPRGLSIAGPGAKVVAVPESSNLEQLARSIKGRELPADGILVATGPIVYYHT